MTTQYDPQRHHRRSIRLKGYDYAQAGAYFVTMVAHGRECLFGEIVGGVMRVNEYGALVAACWDVLPQHFRHAELDAFVVMPNHVHGIVIFMQDAYASAGRGEAFAQPAVPFGTSAPANASPQQHASSPHPHGTKPRSLNALIQNFKSVGLVQLSFRAVFARNLFSKTEISHSVRNDI